MSATEPGLGLRATEPPISFDSEPHLTIAPTAPPTSLKPVLDVIPSECYRNPTWKGLVYLARDLVVYGLAVAGILATDRLVLLVPLWLLAGLAVSSLVIVGPDAAHQALDLTSAYVGPRTPMRVIETQILEGESVTDNDRVHILPIVGYCLEVKVRG